jgi:hypothetical protein
MAAAYSASSIVANNFPATAVASNPEGIASEIMRVLADDGTAFFSSSSRVFANPNVAAAFTNQGFTIVSPFTAVY